jgi:hypothetical protein
VYFLFFPVSGLQLVGILVALQVLEALSLSPVSAAAHFGGMLVGWLAADGSALRRRFARYRARVNQRAREQANVRQARDIAARAVRELRVIEGGKKDPRKPNDSRLN